MHTAQKKIINSILRLRKQGVTPVDMRIILSPKHGKEEVEDAFLEFDKYREFLIRRVLGFILLVFSIIIGLVSYGFIQESIKKNNTIFLIVSIFVFVVCIGIFFFGGYWLISNHKKIRATKKILRST